MDTRRAFLGLALGAATLAGRPAGARPPGVRPAMTDGQGRASQAAGLQDRGAPTGRIGAATRGARDQGDLAVDLVAPLRGTGLAAVDQPELCYVVSGRATRPFRLAISTPGLARPLADFELPGIPPPGLSVLRLRDHRVRLPADRLCVWSLTVPVDPRAPSRDLVCSALIEYRPEGAVRDTDRQAPVASRVAALARAGYWYDAVTLARRNRDADGGAALASLFGQAELPLAGIAAAR